MDQVGPEIYVRKVILNTWLTWRRRRWHGEQATGYLPEWAAPGDRDSGEGRHQGRARQPHQITAFAARRQAARRRVIAAVLTTTVVAILGSGVGVAVATGGLTASPAAGQAKHAGPPRFYLELDTAGPTSSEQRAQVRVTATGAVATTVHCPGRFPFAISAADVVIADGRGSRVSQNSITTGKPLRTLFRVTGRVALIAQLSIDPSTGLLLVTGESGGGPAGTSFNGWIRHGRLVSLKPDIRLPLNSEIW